ncbi:hypothetical protein [Stenotrophomonas sp. JAI102]|uniref:hypothetical protein n=1 Tax=Stenotrophomonas sp. JAI102 TaxID=2723077 RepID=UPI0015CEC281|nr:hypothetical protein [Stenotrophomonas sp. JAI102]NYF36236.1 NhaP-type Na+/H+ or K+/H+ antiporter [Stenotrophomonas sp. JAI102]
MSKAKRLLFWFFFPGLLGFAGGVASLAVASSIPALTVGGSDAISTANTYIVFTTLIFVGFTILITIAGIVFAHQFSTSKDIQVADLASHLKKQVSENQHDCALVILKTALENSDAQRQLEIQIKAKVEEIVAAIVDRSNNDATDAQKQATNLKKQAERIGSLRILFNESKPS